MKDPIAVLLGQRGGKATRKKYGKKHYKRIGKIGKKGGQKK